MTAINRYCFKALIILVLVPWYCDGPRCWESVWSIIVIALTDSNYSDTYINDVANVWFCSSRKVNSDPLNSNIVKDQIKYVTSQISNCRCISRIILLNQGIPRWDFWLKLMLTLQLFPAISKNSFVSIHDCTKQDNLNKNKLWMTQR